MWDLFSTERGRMYVVKSDSHGLGWREISTHDPTVQDAADHAVKTIQRRSNSLFPYELIDILKAKAEVGFLNFNFVYVILSYDCSSSLLSLPTFILLRPVLFLVDILLNNAGH